MRQGQGRQSLSTGKVAVRERKDRIMIMLLEFLSAAGGPVIFLWALQMYDSIPGHRNLYEYHDMHQIQAMEGSGRY